MHSRQNVAPSSMGKSSRVNMEAGRLGGETRAAGRCELSGRSVLVERRDLRGRNGSHGAPTLECKACWLSASHLEELQFPPAVYTHLAFHWMFSIYLLWTVCLTTSNISTKTLYVYVIRPRLSLGHERRQVKHFKFFRLYCNTDDSHWVQAVQAHNYSAV